MLGFFCRGTYTGNEEYRKMIQKRIRMWIWMIVAGIFTFAFAFMMQTYGKADAQEEMISLYEGFGVGLVGASIALIIKNKRLLKDEEKLRKARIAAADERNAEIAAKAMRIAMIVLLVGIYFVMLIGGLWHPELAWALSDLIGLFLIAYVVAYKIIAGRM
ncbi:MAG: hypothetical protein GX234_11080 [Clostridiales bacterium]|nr:hypothetical protein [Clostridiales bacterium]